MSTNDTFEQRALSAGAALRAVFYEGEPMTTTTSYRPPGVGQGEPAHRPGRRLLAAAAVTALLTAGAALVLTGGDEERALPPAQPPQEQAVDPSGIDVAGVQMPLPAGWQISAQSLRYVQAGNPANRAAEGVNVVVPASVVAPDGTRSATPADLYAWLQARPGLTVQVLRPVEVDGRTGRLVRVDPQNGSNVVWCGGPATSSETSSCFNTGPSTVLYLLVPFGDRTLVLERGIAAVADGELTGDDLQQWIDAHLEMAATVTLDD